VHAQIMALFRDHEDLARGFNTFLPDTSPDLTHQLVQMTINADGGDRSPGPMTS
jgi:histone deacetylase complex regulatory component SIN3